MEKVPFRQRSMPFSAAMMHPKQDTISAQQRKTTK